MRIKCLEIFLFLLEIFSFLCVQITLPSILDRIAMRPLRIFSHCSSLKYFLLIFLLMSFVCPPPCHRSFDRSTNLSIHQAHCSIYQQIDTTFENAEAAFAAKRARKRQRKEISLAAKAAELSGAAEGSNHLNNNQVRCSVFDHSI